jgi:hypothetical protein
MLVLSQRSAAPFRVATADGTSTVYVYVCVGGGVSTRYM